MDKPMKKLIIFGLLISTSAFAASEMDNRLQAEVRETKTFFADNLKLNGKELVVGKRQSKKTAAELACNVLGYDKVEKVVISDNSNCGKGECYSLVMGKDSEIKTKDIVDETSYTVATVPFKVLGGLVVAIVNQSNSIDSQFGQGTTYGGAAAISSLTCSKIAN